MSSLSADQHHDVASADDDSSSQATPARGTRLAPGERWYAVYAQPYREARAQQQLKAQGFSAFLPQYRKTVRHARKITSHNAPFFPRYLFVALDLDRHQWRSVNGTFGVTCLVMDGARPRAVPHGIVESLIEVSSSGAIHLGRDLKVGDSVRILSGPFADLVGELVRVDGSERVRVLLKLLSGAVPASINRRDLMRTEGTAPAISTSDQNAIILATT
jgi:transcriptional antiterminator RfaH